MESETDRLRQPPTGRRTSLVRDPLHELGAILRAESLPQVGAPSRLQVAVWALILFVVVVLFVDKYSEFQIGAHQDAANYIVLAKSLVISAQYGLADRPGQPALSQFPFGLPLLLSVVFRIFPDNLDALRLVSLAATLLNCGLLFWGWKGFGLKRSYWWALGITALYAFTPLVIDQSRMVMSEPAFTTACLLALLLAERAAQQRDGRFWAIGMGATLALALFIRTIGFTLILTVFGYLLWKRGLRFARSLALVSLVGALLIVLVVLFTPVAPQDLLPRQYVGTVLQGGGGEGGAADYLFSYPLYKFTDQMGHFMWQSLIPLGGGDAEEALFAALHLPLIPALLDTGLPLLLAFGFFMWMRQDGLSAFNTFPIIYLGVIFFWTWDGSRFLYPVLPQLELALFIGIEVVLVWIARRVLRASSASRLARVCVVVLAAFLLFSALYKSARLGPSLEHDGDLTVRTEWLKAHSGDQDIVMTEQPEVDYIYGGRRTVPFRDDYASAAALEQDLANNRVNYLVIAPSIDWQPKYTPVYNPQIAATLPLAQELVLSGRLKEVYSTPDNWVRIYRVN